jgi:hypothetical protein
VDLPGGTLTLGRGKENDLVLEGDGVSRQHGRIVCEAGAWSIEDLQSTNGIRLNGRRIATREALRAGDHIGIGCHLVEFTDTDTAVKPPQPELSPPPPAAAPAGRRPFPWVQAALLLLLLAGLGVLAWLTFFPGTPAQTAVPAVPSVQVPAPATATPATPPPATPETGGATEPEPPAPAPDTPAAPGTVLVNSEPTGAAVQVDGKAVPGATPLMIPNLAPGRHTVTVTLRGYETFTRQFQYPSQAPDKPYELRQKAGTIRITSTPAGAMIQYGPRILGQTPLLVDDLKPGSHEFTASLAGYETKTAPVELSADQPAILEVALESRMGNLEVVTTPPGCEIYSGNSLLGQTAADPAGGEASAPLVITGLAVGEHEIVARHASGAAARTRAKVTSQGAERISLAPWFPDTELTLAGGGTRYGVLKGTSPQGDVTLAFPSARVKTYPKAQIAATRALTAEEIRGVVGRMDAGSLKDEMEPNAGSDAAAGPAPTLYAAEKIQEAMQAGKAAGLVGATIRIRGVPASLGSTGTEAVVLLIGNIRCVFAMDNFTAARTVIRAAQKAQQPVTIQGTVRSASPTDGFVLGGATLVP